MTTTTTFHSADCALPDGPCDCGGGFVIRAEQPAPRRNAHPPIWPQVIADMQARDALGRRRYGTALRPFNGRVALQDAYEEALDLAVYLKQALVERRHLATALFEISRADVPADVLRRMAWQAVEEMGGAQEATPCRPE